MIGDDVEVVVLGIQGEQIKLGIIAPKRVAVHRKEIYEQIQTENKEASSRVNVEALKDFAIKK